MSGRIIELDQLKGVPWYYCVNMSVSHTFFFFFFYFGAIFGAVTFGLDLRSSEGSSLEKS